VVYGWNPPVVQQDMNFDEFTGINNNEWRVNDFDDLPPDEFNNY
jgi:hypothetical protein